LYLFSQNNHKLSLNCKLAQGNGFEPQRKRRYRQRSCFFGTLGYRL